MANRMKEDEKNEKIIRGLLKLPANRKCINCNSLGPQYVCTNFWTFICTNCSGIHREFTHRVKSVSMAKFTSLEVSSLQGGGNECAKEIYLKEWDQQRHSVPDSSNVERLRDFIKHVYVDRRYTGERSIDKPPRVKMGDKEDSYENRRVDTYRGGSRSPPYEDTYERRYSERSGPGGRNDDRNFRYNYDERRSPGYDQESQRYGDYRKSPARFEVVDDRFRDDRSGNGRRSEDRRLSDGESRLEGRSPNHQKDLDMSSPPVARPVRDILGEDLPPLRVGEPPKANGSRVSDGSVHTQRTASSSSLGSIDGNSVELKRENLGSLIDFNADPEPPDAAAVPQTQPTPPPMSQSVTQPVTSSSIAGGNWASFDIATQEVSQAPSNVNTLESVLSQLSAPASLPVHNMSTLPLSSGAPAAVPVGNMSILLTAGGPAAAPVGHISTSHGGGNPATAPLGNMLTFPVSAPTAAFGGISGNSLIKATDGGQWPSVQQHQHSLFPATDSQSTAQQFTPSVGGAPNNQPWSSSLAPNAPGTLTSSVQSSQANLAQDVPSGVASQPVPVEAKPIGRKELPPDLFSATYSPVPVPVPGWQTGPPRGMGFGMQYPTAVTMPTFPHSSKSTNPFDLNTEPTLVQAPTFPSMASLQGALPSMARPTGLLRTSSLGNPSPQWMLPQSPSNASALPLQSPSYASAVPPQSPSYASAVPPQSTPYGLTMPPSAYMGQQSSSNMQPFGHQGVGGFSNDGAVFSTMGTDQQLAGRYSQPATPNSFSSLGGNPFG